MRTLVITSTCGIIATIVAGCLAWNTDNKALLETYRVFLGFTIIGIAGTIMKAIVDNVIEQDRKKKEEIASKERIAAQEAAEEEKKQQRRYEEWESTRTAILREFIDIFSEFYSLRKLYHSALSKSNSIYEPGTEAYAALLRDNLKNATDLEGRYGALKILIIRHFDLPDGNFEYRSLKELITELETAKSVGDRLRVWLDILGEAYDDWRHGLEEDRKIKPTESWEAYRVILAFIDSQRWNSSNDGS